MSDSNPVTLQPAPLRSPMFGRDGMMSLVWQRYFQTLFYVGGQVNENTVNIVDIQQTQPSFDDRTPHNYFPDIEAAVVRSAADAVRDFTPAIEAAQLADSPECRRDYSPDIETARVFNQGDAAPRVDADELRALALFATPPGGASGSFTTADGHTVTVQGGQITSIV